MSTPKIIRVSQAVDDTQEPAVPIDAFRLPSMEKFSAVNKLIVRDLNNNTGAPSFYKYSKDQIATFLQNPYSNANALRNAVVYLYNASSHFKRLIQYFASLSDLSYVVSPYRIDTSTAKPNTLKKNYRKVLDLLSSMDIRRQFLKVLTVCLREDTFYGTMWVTDSSVAIQQLPSEYCNIAVVEDSVLNVSFDFSYFDAYSANLPFYPSEFQRKYKIYQNDRNKRWQELDSPTSFAIKANDDILTYPIPPFVGILREIFDIEDYKALKMSKTELENYALLVMTIGTDSDGNWTMDLNKAREFWRNLDGVLPEEVGSILTPMPISKISFERSNVGDTDTIAAAEENLFTAAGVSSLLFNNEKASSNALSLSIKADQALTFGIVKNIESMLNRFIRSFSYGKNFKITFLDCSPFNRKEVGDAYLKACQCGMPMVSFYCASQGLMQADMDTMNFLEDTVLGVKQRFVPLQLSSTQSANSTAGGEPGRPTKDAGELTEAGEIDRESA